MINFKIKSAIKKKAIESLPNECCGFVLSNGEVVFCENASHNPTKEFSIKPEVFLQNLRKGIKLVFHSHPAGTENFSIPDKIYNKHYDLPLVVYSVKTNKFNFLIDNVDFLKYETDEYDCFSFAKSYIEDKFKINFNSFLSAKTLEILSFEKTKPPLDYLQDEVIQEMMEEAKFKTVSRNELNNDDMIFFKRLNFLHVGISFEKYILHKTKKNSINLIDQSFIKESDWLKCYRYVG